MHELIFLVIIVAAVMALVTVATRVIRAALRWLEYALLAGSIAVTLFVMLFISTDVMMRYFFNSPIPGQLEGSELLMPIIVFLPLSYTQATRGHVGMDLLVDLLPPSIHRYLEIGTLLLTVIICSVLAFFSFKNAYQLWLYDDITATQPYFHTWPAAAAVPLGYSMISIRMYLQVLHLIDPRRFPEGVPMLHPQSAHE